MSADLRGSSSDASGPADQPRPAEQAGPADRQPVPPVPDQAAGAEARRQKYAHLTEGSGSRADLPARRPEETGKMPSEARPQEAHALSDRRYQTLGEYQKARSATPPAQHPDRPHDPGRPQVEGKQPGVDKAPDAGRPQGAEHANGVERAGAHPYPGGPQQRPSDPAREAETGKHQDGAAITHLHWDYQGTNTDVYTDGTRSAHLYSPTGKPRLGHLVSEGAEPAKGDPAALPAEVGKYLSTGDRQVGIPVVGEKPDKSPGDSSDLPPGPELVKMEDDDASRMEKIARESFTEVRDVIDLTQHMTETVDDILQRPTYGHTSVPAHGTAYEAAPVGGMDPGSVASTAVVLGVLGVKAVQAAHGEMTKALHGAGTLIHRVNDTVNRRQDDASNG